MCNVVCSPRRGGLERTVWATATCTRHDHDWELHNRGTRTNVGKNSFQNRTSRDWKALPKETFEVEYRAMFKRKLTT